MAKGYWIAHVEVTDPETYKKYLAANAVAFAKYGARFLVRGGTHVVAKGAAKSRHVVIEFPDYAAALALSRFSRNTSTPPSSATPPRSSTSSSPKATTGRKPS